MAVDLEIAKRFKEGLVTHHHHVERLTKRVKRLQSRYNETISAEGVPEKFVHLVSLAKKSEVQKFCKTLVVTEHDLFLMIHNCAQIGFRHRSRFPEFVPDHLEIHKDDEEKMADGDFHPISKKMSAILKERRNIHVHLFDRGEEWHCLYFSFEDIELDESNHWKKGCHIHYVSHLWPNFTKEQVWNKFNVRSTEIRGNIHISFIPFDYSSPDDVRTNNSFAHGLQSPAAILFNSNFTSVNNSEPVPVAHITTRGSWSITISTPSDNRLRTHPE